MSGMKAGRERLFLFFLRNAALFVFLGVFLVIGIGAPRFHDPKNLLNILIQASSGGIAAIGMTFVLLTAGIDLSVGAVMFLSAAVAGKMVLAGVPFPLALAAILAIGAACGAVNAFFIVRLKVMPFVATLATQFMGFGLGLWITQTRAMNLPAEFSALGTARILGIPSPVLVFLAVLVVSHITLTRTQFGRQIYAVGNNLDGARRAGIDASRILALVYVLSGLLAALGGMVLLAQIGAVNEKFGRGQEFIAVATAVLGGTSLFGGKGTVFPGTCLGAILTHTIRNALDILQAGIYSYPLVTAAVIFLAVLLDSLQNAFLLKIGRRKIRVE